MLGAYFLIIDPLLTFSNNYFIIMIPTLLFFLHWYQPRQYNKVAWVPAAEIVIIYYYYLVTPTTKEKSCVTA